MSKSRLRSIILNSITFICIFWLVYLWFPNIKEYFADYADEEVYARQKVAEYSETGDVSILTGLFKEYTPFISELNRSAKFRAHRLDVLMMMLDAVNRRPVVGEEEEPGMKERLQWEIVSYIADETWRGTETDIKELMEKAKSLGIKEDLATDLTMSLLRSDLRVGEYFQIVLKNENAELKVVRNPMKHKRFYVAVSSESRGLFGGVEEEYLNHWDLIPHFKTDIDPDADFITLKPGDELVIDLEMPEPHLMPGRYLFRLFFQNKSFGQSNNVYLDAEIRVIE